MTNSAEIAGVITVTAGCLGALYIWLLYESKRISWLWILPTLFAIAVGFGLGHILFDFTYYPSKNVRVVGFPFVAAVFELQPGGLWMDFVGPWTLVYALGNFFVGLTAPVAVLATLAAIYAYIKKLAEPGAGPNPAPRDRSA